MVVKDLHHNLKLRNNNQKKKFVTGCLRVGRQARHKNKCAKAVAKFMTRLLRVLCLVVKSNEEKKVGSVAQNMEIFFRPH